MKNFITVNNNIGECNHPMIYDDQMDYNFELADNYYEEWLFAGGNYDDISKFDDNGYPRDGFYQETKKISISSDNSLDDMFIF